MIIDQAVTTSDLLVPYVALIHSKFQDDQHGFPLIVGLSLSSTGFSLRPYGKYERQNSFASKSGTDNKVTFGTNELLIRHSLVHLLPRIFLTMRCTLFMSG